MMRRMVREYMSNKRREQIYIYTAPPPPHPHPHPISEAGWRTQNSGHTSRFSSSGHCTPPPGSIWLHITCSFTPPLPLKLVNFENYVAKVFRWPNLSKKTCTNSSGIFLSPKIMVKKPILNKKYAQIFFGITKTHPPHIYVS